MHPMSSTRTCVVTLSLCCSAFYRETNEISKESRPRPIPRHQRLKPRRPHLRLPLPPPLQSHEYGNQEQRLVSGASESADAARQWCAAAAGGADAGRGVQEIPLVASRDRWHPALSSAAGAAAASSASSCYVLTKSNVALSVVLSFADQCIQGILPLRRAIVEICGPTNKHLLTSIHADFMYACIKAHHYRAAIPVLDVSTFAIDPKVTHSSPLPLSLLRLRSH